MKSKIIVAEDEPITRMDICEILINALKFLQTK